MKIQPAIHICIFILTTPWECLREPIVHILKMTPGELQIRKVEVWCNNKIFEFSYVAVAVSRHYINSKILQATDH